MMDNIYFYKKDGRLVSYIKTPRIKTFTEKQTQRVLKEIEKQKYNNICYFGRNISFEVEGIKFTLKNKDDFEKDLRFQRIFDIIRHKKYKLQVGVLAILLSGTTILGTITIEAINKKSANEIVPETSVSNEVLEVNYSINKESNLSNEKEINKTNISVKQQDESTKKAAIPTTQNVTEDDLSILKIGSESDSEKAIKTRKEYKNIIDKYAKMYGLNADVILSIATQERGVHASTVDAGGAIGLMQIQVAVWNNKSIMVHNVLTNETDKINITLDKLRDVDFNVRSGCAIFQNYLNLMGGNYFLAVQCYNMGPNTVSKILNECSLNTSKSIDEIKHDYNNLDWFKYVNNSYAGDPNYVRNVYRYYEENAKTK